jgi:hypothetical protein
MTPEQLLFAWCLILVIVVGGFLAAIRIREWYLRREFDRIIHRGGL